MLSLEGYVVFGKEEKAQRRMGGDPTQSQADVNFLTHSVMHLPHFGYQHSCLPLSNIPVPTCCISRALLCFGAFAPTNASSWNASPIQPHPPFKASPRSTICWQPFVSFTHSFDKHPFSMCYVPGDL